MVAFGANAGKCAAATAVLLSKLMFPLGLKPCGYYYRYENSVL
jgi:hypothetical protein